MSHQECVTHGPHHKDNLSARKPDPRTELQHARIKDIA